MPEVKLGINLWSQASNWPEFLAAGRRADALGYEHLWTWDHLHAIFGDPDQNIWEGYTALAALAMATERVKLGLFVGANPFRNPGLAAKSVVTIDHISGGRAMLGIGGAWFEHEHNRFGIDFGSGFGQRLDWLAEAVSAIRTLLDGGEVTSEPDGHYAFDHLTIHPLPIQRHLPIVIGGAGERKTLRIVAQSADVWNVFGTPETVARKNDILKAHCEEVGRNETEIERTLGCKVAIRDTWEEAERVRLATLEHNKTPLSRVEGDVSFWTGTPEQIAEIVRSYQDVGFNTFIAEVAAPYDDETMTRLIQEVKPMVEGAVRA